VAFAYDFYTNPSKNNGVLRATLTFLNSVFSAVKRKARGYRSTDNLITMVYFTAGKLRIPASH